MANKPTSINLLRNEQISVLDKVINWALTVGRLLVILTELIALSSFLYRFSLDRQLIDLHSKIKQEQAIVAILKNNEDKYRNLQDRLSLASSFSNSENATPKIFQDVIRFAPSDMTFNSLTLNKNGINIDASIQTTSSLSSFVNSLTNYPLIKTVAISNIENKPLSSSIAVSITASLKQK
ncbi:MAG: PilN domain-containing protein [Patescibacteria group bacterium]